MVRQARIGRWRLAEVSELSLPDFGEGRVGNFLFPRRLPDLPGGRSEAAGGWSESWRRGGGRRFRGGCGGLDRASALLLRRWWRLWRSRRPELDEQRIGIEQRGRAGTACAGLGRDRTHRPGFRRVAVERDGDGEFAPQRHAHRAGRTAGAADRDPCVSAGRIGFDRQRRRRRLGRKKIHAGHCERAGREAQAARHDRNGATRQIGSLLQPRAVQSIELQLMDPSPPARHPAAAAKRPTVHDKALAQCANFRTRKISS
jgi:hypothetical protein